MNKTKYLILMLAGLLLAIAPAVSSPAATVPERDTVILEFGNNSRIIIYIDSQEDLAELTRYDINRILSDLNMKIARAGDSTEVVEIRDETGSQYLKDTTVIIYRVTDTPGDEPDDDWETSDEDDDRDRGKTVYHHFDEFAFSFDIGLNNYLEKGRFPAGNTPYALMPLGSWYWNLGPAYKARLFGPVYLDLALTAAFNVYRFNDHRTRLNTENGVRFETDTTVAAPLKSKLASSYLMVRAVPMLAFPAKNHRHGFRLWNPVSSGFRIGAGMYVGYRVWSRTKYTYDDGGKQKRKKTASHLLNDIRYGIRGQIGFREIDLFVEYDLNEVFQEGQGAPPLQRIQFGITL